MLDDEETGFLFQTYKMHLKDMDANAIAADGREMPLMKVISESLKFIADKAIAKLTEQVGKVVKTRIKWVLTVPALWEEQHKNFMRQAAVEAGIIDNVSDTNMLLCLEPEGASISVREDAEETVSAPQTAAMATYAVIATAVPISPGSGGPLEVSSSSSALSL